MTIVKDINGRRFAASIAESKAKRVFNNKLNRYEMSWIATIPEKEELTEQERAEKLRESVINKGRVVYKTDTYVGIDYLQPLPNPYWTKNTPCVAPTLIQVTKFLPCGLADQKLLFGLRHSKRYMKKQSALDLLFVPRPLRPCEQVAKALSLSTNENDEVNTTWIPTTQNPIDVMANNEQYSIRQRDARLELDRIKQLIGDKRFELLVLSAEGMNAREIAEKTGGSYEAIKKNLQRIKKQLTEAQQKA